MANITSFMKKFFLITLIFNATVAVVDARDVDNPTTNQLTIAANNSITIKTTGYYEEFGQVKSVPLKVEVIETQSSKSFNISGDYKRVTVSSAVIECSKEKGPKGKTYSYKFKAIIDSHHRFSPVWVYFSL